MRSASSVADEIISWVETGRGVRGTIVGILIDWEREIRGRPPLPPARRELVEAFHSAEVSCVHGAPPCAACTAKENLVVAERNSSMEILDHIDPEPNE